MEGQLEFQWSFESQFSIFARYYLNLFATCDLNHAFKKAMFHRSAAMEGASFAEELKSIFMVPRLNKLHRSQNRVNKYQLVQAFLSFLLQLLHHKPDPITENLEKELRFLLTILRDLSWILYDGDGDGDGDGDDEHEAEFQKLLEEFEAVANQAGSLLHSLFFSVDTDIQAFDVLLHHFDLLKVDIIKFLHLPSSSRGSAHTTHVEDSLLIVDSLICDLDDLMNRDDNRLADANDQIKILHQRLIYLQSSVRDVEFTQPWEIGEFKQPLMHIGDTAHEAEYLILTFLVRDIPLWYFINRLTNINCKVELMGTELQEITNKYKFGDLFRVPKHFAPQKLLQGKRNPQGEDVTVGLEGNVTDILDQLVGGGTERLRVISILGMPGIGKTTLAKKLYNHSSVIYWFDKLSWCVVSQTYLRRNVLTDILIHIKSDFDEDRILKMEEESILEHIYKTLKGRRYLIVMDDIWDSDVWDDLQRCFPDDGNGSRILFTTRNRDVATPNSSMIYEQPFLSDDQCWELLEKKVFDNKSCPPELLRVGMKIAANCRGLPLAVIVIAGILSAMDMEESTWEEVRANLASYIFDGGADSSVMQILELSYKHLPDHLKPCFLYFGAFDEDKEIPVRNLMRLWIAEGFVPKREEKSAENVAEEYLTELIDKSLVMVAKRRSDGGVKTCVIHDLLHDLCLKRSKEENLRKFVKLDFYSTLDRDHSLQPLNHEYIPVSWSYCQHVRSFHGHRLNSEPLYARDMSLLRVLDFDYIYNNYIGIEFLVYLRYLVISDLPPSIGNLVNLEYLRVTKTRKTVNLPSEIMKMRKLRYIQVGSEAIYSKGCNRSQANNLEFLSGVVIRDLEDEEMLKCSPHLCRLKYGYKVPPAVAPYRHFDLRFLTQLESLSLALNGQRLTVEKLIKFPSNIRKLTLSDAKLHWENMSIIGRLENLEVLKLRVVHAYEDKIWNTRDGEYQKLRFFKLDTRHLAQWNVESSQHFPQLQQLVLFGCCNLQEIPCEIGEILTLQLIEVKGRSPNSLAESAKRIQQEQWDMGIEDLRVITDCK